MNDFFNMNWLVITKSGEWKYFKHMKNIAEHLNTTVSKISSSKTHCLRYYNHYCPHRDIYIQCLYNDNTKQFPEDTTFLWNAKDRTIFYKNKFDYYPKFR